MARCRSKWRSSMAPFHSTMLMCYMLMILEWISSSHGVDLKVDQLEFRFHSIMAIVIIKGLGVPPVGALWTLLSLVLGVTQMFVLFQPGWLIRPGQSVHKNSDHSKHLHLAVNSVNLIVIQRQDMDQIAADEYSLSFGLVTRCYEKRELRFTLCRPYLKQESSTNLLNMLSIPTKLWTATFCLYGMGSVFVTVSGLFGLISMLMRHEEHINFVAAAARMQIMAVTLQAVGLVCAVWPTYSHNTDNAIFLCNTSHYGTTPCHLGWSSTLAIFAALITALCPILAKHTTYEMTPQVQIYTFDETPHNAFDDEEKQNRSAYGRELLI